MVKLMARKPMVTRTITSTKVTLMCVNTVAQTIGEIGDIGIDIIVAHDNAVDNVVLFKCLQQMLTGVDVSGFYGNSAKVLVGEVIVKMCINDFHAGILSGCKIILSSV